MLIQEDSSCKCIKVLKVALFIYCSFIYSWCTNLAQLIANKNQLTKITKCLYNVKREVAHSVIHYESISKMFQNFGILTDHIATSQLGTIKSRVTGDYMIRKNTRMNEKLAQSVLHSLKSVQIRSYFWSVFSPNVGKCGPEITPYLDTFHAVLPSTYHTPTVNTSSFLDKTLEFRY